jgi:hypothetical protein
MNKLESRDWKYLELTPPDIYLRARTYHIFTSSEMQLKF